jgi:hypothetical protein
MPGNTWTAGKGDSYLINREEYERTGYVCPISSKLNKVSPEKQKRTELITLKICTICCARGNGLKRLSNTY